MNYIFLSEKESFNNGAEKIQQEAFLQTKECKIIDLESIFNERILLEDGKKPLCYFLTNDFNLPLYVELLREIGLKIVNDKFLSGSSLKFVLQQKIKRGGVNTPKSTWITSKDPDLLKSIQYPFFLKDQKQAGIVEYVENKIKLAEKLKAVQNIKGIYFEEAVEKSPMFLKKFYYIIGSVIDMDTTTKEPVPLWLESVFKKISQSLDLEVFSADVFVDLLAKDYSCIDVNPAPAFFKSDIACSEFVKNVFI